MLDNATNRDVKTAGVWFVGQYGGLLLEKLDEINRNPSTKADLTHKIFLQAGRDKDIAGTKWRVSAVLSIIKRGTLKDALRYVVQSVRVNREDPQAVQMAETTLEKLELNNK